MTPEPDVTDGDTGEHGETRTPDAFDARTVGTSRRRFLAGSTVVGIGALGLGSGLAGAQDGDDDGNGDDGPGDDDDGRGDDDGDDDGPDDDNGGDDDDGGIGVLNFALTLEHLEYALYRDALATFDASDLTGTGVAIDLLQDVRDHERAHVAALTRLIERRGGTPVEADEYDFGYGSVGEFLQVAMEVENAVVAAYAGAAPRLDDDDVGGDDGNDDTNGDDNGDDGGGDGNDDDGDDDRGDDAGGDGNDDDAPDDDGNLLVTLLSIHSVEARHAAFINELNVESPFPAAFDRPISRREALALVDRFTVE